MPELGFSVVSPATVNEAREFLRAATPPSDSPTQLRIFSAEHIDSAFDRQLRQPRWVWAARDEAGATLGVVAGWGAPARETPWILDFIDVPLGDPSVARVLLDHAVAEASTPGSTSVEFDLFAPAEDPLGDPGTAALVQVLEECGFRLLVQRRRYRLEVAASEVRIPETQLRFDPLPGDGLPRLTALFADILVGSLDAHDRLALETQGVETVAAATAEEYLELDGVDSIFVASNESGEEVGLVIGGLRGSADAGAASFIGVSHRHRGNGYGAQLLGWITERMIGAGAASIGAETDVQNVPMAAAFTRVGYVQTESRLDLLRDV